MEPNAIAMSCPTNKVFWYHFIFFTQYQHICHTICVGGVRSDSDENRLFSPLILVLCTDICILIKTCEILIGENVIRKGNE